MLRERRHLPALVAGLLVMAAAPAYSMVAKPPARSFERQLAVTPGHVARLTTDQRFNLVGLRWRGARSARVSLRARTGGHWSPWVEVGHSDGIGRGGRTVSDPVWAGEADALELRSDRSLPGLVADFQNTTGTATARDRAVTAMRHGVAAVARPVLGLIGGSGAQAAPVAPHILPRSSWNDGSCRPRAKPLYGSVRMALVHHTVTLNDYSPEDSASIVLAICRYHVQQNGWNDIGYNFLADKYGQVFEGRAGGIDQAVVGAQAQGWNSQSTGVSVLGTYTQTPLSQAGLNALGQLLAWKLSLHGVSPLGRVTLTSPGGSENRWSAGSRVTFDNDLRPSRRRQHRLPGRRALRAAPGDPAAGRRGGEHLGSEPGGEPAERALPRAGDPAWHLAGGRQQRDPHRGALARFVASPRQRHGPG